MPSCLAPPASPHCKEFVKRRRRREGGVEARGAEGGGQIEPERGHHVEAHAGRLPGQRRHVAPGRPEPPRDQTFEQRDPLVAVEALPEETIAEIEVSGEIGGTVPDEEFGELDFSMKLKGKERRSLERAVEIESSASGSIHFSGSYVEDGLPVSLSMSGALTVRVKGALL